MNITELFSLKGKTALVTGAAYGIGIYSSVPEACREVVKTDKIQNPIPENIKPYEDTYRFYTEIYPALKASFKKLAEL